MPLPWIKLWLESLDDPKLIRLSLAERGAWWGVIQLAGKCDAGGKIVSGRQPLDIDEIADALHIKTGEDRAALESMIDQMEKRGSLKWNENSLTVVHWEERQRVPPSARPEAVAERVRRFRERQKPYREAKGSGNKIPKICPVCGFKALTDETLCPKCVEQGKDTELQRDYKGGKYGHLVGG